MDFSQNKQSTTNLETILAVNSLTRHDFSKTLAKLKTQITEKIETGHTTEAETLAKKVMSFIEVYGYEHIDYFAKTFLPHYVTTEFAPHHLEMFDCIRRGEVGQKKNIIAPRGSAKSTCMAVIYPLHRICYKSYDEAVGYEPDHFILMLSRTYPMAISRIKAIKYELETNEILRTAFGNLVGKTWGEKEIVTKNGVCLKAIGRGGQIRGALFRNFRPSLIISDDLDDPETVNNPDVRQKDMLWFDSDLIRAGNLDGTTNFINIDTVKHKSSIANVLRERPQWETLFYPAILHPIELWHPTAEEKWKQWESIWTDMSKEKTERTAEADMFYQANKAEMHGTEIKELWPKQITYLDVRKEICDVGYFPVMREFQNNPHDRSQALFDMENALRFSIVPEGFLRSDKILVKWEEMSGATVFLDWAGGKDLAENCFAAVVGVVWVPLPGSTEEKTDSLMGGTNAYVFFDHLVKVGPTQQIAACLDMIEKIRAAIPNRNFSLRLGIEGFVQDTWDAQKQMIERDFRAQREKRNQRDIPHIEWLSRLKNKYDRIDALQPPIYNRWIGFHQKLSAEFMAQMADYPTGDHLDAPDALEGACQLRVTTFQSKRTAQRNQARQRNKNFKVRI